MSSEGYSVSKIKYIALPLSFATNLRLSECLVYLDGPHLCIGSEYDISNLNPKAIQLCLNRLARLFSPVLFEREEPFLGDLYVASDYFERILQASACLLVHPIQLSFQFSQSSLCEDERSSYLFIRLAKQ